MDHEQLKISSVVNLTNDSNCLLEDHHTSKKVKIALTLEGPVYLGNSNQNKDELFK